ncbi:MAG: hypothetical protein IPO08_20585 [Xanthomonadales bacterium]|nr:hypothetical protein [Xanthomonadales bacterium]
MARVTLYEYDGETRRENGVSVNWRQVGEPVEFNRFECSFDEALGDTTDGNQLKRLQAWTCDWEPSGRNEHGHLCYEAETDDRPLYRAEVEE